jgi:hypothetical protein
LLYNYLNPSILPPLVGNDKPQGGGRKDLATYGRYLWETPIVVCFIIAMTLKIGGFTPPL